MCMSDSIQIRSMDNKTEKINYRRDFLQILLMIMNFIDYSKLECLYKGLLIRLMIIMLIILGYNNNLNNCSNNNNRNHNNHNNNNYIFNKSSCLSQINLNIRVYLTQMKNNNQKSRNKKKFE